MYPRTYVAYVVYVSDTLQIGAIDWRGGNELLNKVKVKVLHTKRILVAS